ncbi:uncharacterized protein LOC123543606 isoform X2 [Mercenaria mercenaria]|uniref:uncharacterized protein LOC123543606 isoform X2 n=1 Tax=Mercenaria mercenaria TaxID=6596 RepID=UPI00234F8F26|nr:uncharacterized protein LOC123543606 isoform X2 [Mercenaria mercenaria]
MPGFKDLLRKFEGKPLVGQTSSQQLKTTMQKEPVPNRLSDVFDGNNGLKDDVKEATSFKKTTSDNTTGGSKAVVSNLVVYFTGWVKNNETKTSNQKQFKSSTEANKRGIVSSNTSSTNSNLRMDNKYDTETYLQQRAETKQVNCLSTGSANHLTKCSGASGKGTPNTREDIAANVPYIKVDKPPLQENPCTKGSIKNIAHLVGINNTHVEHNEASTKDLSRQRNGQMDANGFTKLDKTSPHRKGELDSCKSASNIPKWSLLQFDDESDSLCGSETADKKTNHHGNSFQATNNVLQRTNQETAVKVSSRSATTTRTSGVYSDSTQTLSKNNESAMKSTEDMHMNERRAKNTARYVKEVESQLPSRRKYPSEPSNLQNQNIPCGKITRTQENVVKISDSRFSISTPESESGYTESFSVSQISFVSSDQQEIRESTAEQTRQILETHAVSSEISRHRRLKEAKRILDRDGVVFLVSRNGSGSSHLGWDLLSLDTNTEKYNLLEVDHFQICTRSKESATFLADDAFGISNLDKSALDKWLRYVNVSKRNKSRNVKFIFTVKHHILRQCEDKLSDYEKCIVDVERLRLQMDSEEMLDIMINMVENNKDKFKIVLTEENVPVEKKSKSRKYAKLSKQLLSDISENASAVGFPKRFQKFIQNKANIKQGLHYFTLPSKNDLNDMTDMKRSDLDSFLTLVLIALYGELKLAEVCSIDQKRHECAIKRSFKKTKKKTKKRTRSKEERIEESTEIPWWIEIINHYAQHCKDSLYESVETGITLLKGYCIREDKKDVFGFAAPCVKNAVFLTFGQDFPQHILKVCDLSFFKDCVCSDRYFITDKTKCVKIDVSNKVVCSEANKRLLELHANGDIQSFAKHKLLEDGIFIQQFIDSFGKNIDQLWNVIKNDGGNMARCVISCSLENKSSSHHGMVGNLVYSILRHKVWNQKRKGNREWTSQKESEVIKHCCEQGDTEIYFELRRKYNIPVNFQCLQLAIKSGSYAIVNDIMGSVGKDLSDEEKCKGMERALIQFSRNPSKCHHDVVKALLKVVSVDYKIKGVDPIIHTAGKTGDTRVLVTLEVFDGDINVTNSEGKTILHEAIKRKKTAFMTVALNHGADQRKADRSGLLPIHEGAIQNKPHMIRLLMKADENIAMTRDKYGRQPLHYAAINKSFEAANCLIEHGVEIDAYDYKQKTPLHYAAESGKGTVVHSLLEANADINKQDKDGHSPLLFACKNGNVQGVKRLLRKREFMKLNVNTPCNGMFLVHFAASSGERKVFQMLTDAGAHIKEVTQDSNDTVLHIAVEKGHNKLVYHILQKDDSLIGCRNKKGEVPLHIAARHGNLSVTRTLLAHGAERSPINKRSETPISLVERKLSELKRHTEEYENYYSVKMLLSGHKVMLETAL